MTTGPLGSAESSSKEANSAAAQRAVSQLASRVAARVRASSCSLATLIPTLKSKRPALVASTAVLSKGRRVAVNGWAREAPRAACWCASRCKAAAVCV